jgi:hypothetical protein
MPADLDERLRRALALPHEPAASRESLRSVTSALPRYRARRRAIVGATGASVLGVLGLTLGLLVVGLQGSSTTTTAAPPVQSGASPRAAAGPPTCVRVQVGSGVARCAGRITSIVNNGSPAMGAEAGPLSDNGQLYAPQEVPAPTATIRAAVGERVVLSLPHLSGVDWSQVTLHNTAFRGPGSGNHPLATHINRATGSTVAVVSHAAGGGYTLVATGSVTCPTASTCASSTRVWVITLDVR